MLDTEISFDGVESGWQTGVMILLVALPAILALILSRSERQSVTRWRARCIFALRAVLFVLVFVALLRPVVLQPTTISKSRTVIVAVDVSKSMDTRDTHAKKSEKIRWARALGMIGNEQTNQRLDRWSNAYDTNSEPEWVAEDEVSDPNQRRQLADSRRLNLENVLSQVDQLTRYDICARLLMENESRLATTIRKRGKYEVYQFAGDSRRIDIRDSDQPIPKLTDELDPLSTDIEKLLSDRTNSSKEQDSIAGIILLTDGRDNSGEDVAEAARRLGNESIPIFPIMMGSEISPNDIAIESIEFPEEALQGDLVRLRTVLKTNGFEGEDINVVLSREGEETDRQSVRIDGPLLEVEFPLETRDVGRHNYSIKSELLDGELLSDNNERELAINVVDGNTRVLLVDGEARWEFRFIETALSRDDHVEVEKVVFQQPYMNVLDSSFFESQLDVAGPNESSTESAFSNTDLVIIGDVSATDFSTEAWEQVDEFVFESGGTLVLLAGKRNFPRGHRSEVVDRLLPLTNLSPLQVAENTAAGDPQQRGFHLQLTSAGAREDVLQFGVDAAANRTIWGELPGHSWGLVGQEKPGATVWARFILPNESQARDSVEERPAIVHQYYGFGQVIWIGFDSTWRWRHRIGDGYHHRFWGQLTRLAIRNKSMAANDSVRFGTEKLNLNVGEPAIVEAELSEPFLRRFPEVSTSVVIHRITSDGESIPHSRLDLTPRPAEPRFLQGQTSNLPAGEYQLELVAQNADLGHEQISTSVFVRDPQPAEQSEIRANRELLSAIARNSGGQLLMPDEVEKLTELIRSNSADSTGMTSIRIWDHWALLVAFLTILCTEWILRKRGGLP